MDAQNEAWRLQMVPWKWSQIPSTLIGAGSGPALRWKAGSGSALKWCGSGILVRKWTGQKQSYPHLHNKTKANGKITLSDKTREGKMDWSRNKEGKCQRQEKENSGARTGFLTVTRKKRWYKNIRFPVYDILKWKKTPSFSLGKATDYFLSKWEDRSY